MGRQPSMYSIYGHRCHGWAPQRPFPAARFPPLRPSAAAEQTCKRAGAGAPFDTVADHTFTRAGRPVHAPHPIESTLAPAFRHKDAAGIDPAAAYGLRFS